MRNFIIFVFIFFFSFKNSFSFEVDKKDVITKISNQIFLEIYFNLFYNYNQLKFNNNIYNDVIHNTMPQNFGGGVGFILNDLLFVEFNIFGGKNKIYENQQFGISSGELNTVFLRTNTGIRIPLLTNTIAFLVHAGGLVYFQSGKYNYTTNLIPVGFNEMNIGIMPELGLGLEYRLAERFSIKFECYYAFVVNSSTSSMMRSVMTIQTGISIKL